MCASCPVACAPGMMHLSVATDLAVSAICPCLQSCAEPCPPQIRELQRVAVASWLMKEARISEQRRLHAPDAVCLFCVNCNVAVCRGSDIRTVEGMHHVNVNPKFGYEPHVGRSEQANGQG